MPETRMGLTCPIKIKQKKSRLSQFGPAAVKTSLSGKTGQMLLFVYVSKFDVGPSPLGLVRELVGLPEEPGSSIDITPAGSDDGLLVGSMRAVAVLEDL